MHAESYVQKMSWKAVAIGGVLLLTATTFAGCFGGGTTQQTITLNGSGATFPAPLYDKWQAAYTNTTPTTRITYQSVGSGAGITAITKKEVDFGASDAPMNPTELAAAPGILHIPTTLGAVIVIYNLPGVNGQLAFTATTLSRIFNGNITDWNDAELGVDNAGAGLASIAHNITIVHRSDSSGTTFVFTSYLHKADPTNWTTNGAKGWPSTLGIGGQGNAGVATGVSQNPYSIGYVELAYVLTQASPPAQAKLKNHDGQWVTATTASTNAAAAALGALPAGDGDWSGVNILDQPGATAYPIASMTYLLVYKTQSDSARGKALVDFLWWGVHDGGQNLCEPNGYVRLPASVVTHDEATIRMIKDAGGAQLHS